MVAQVLGITEDEARALIERCASPSTSNTDGLELHVSLVPNIFYSERVESTWAGRTMVMRTRRASCKKRGDNYVVRTICDVALERLG